MWGEAKTVEFLNKLKANDIRTAAGNAGDLPVTAEERTLCVAQGRRLAQVARKLAS